MNNLRSTFASDVCTGVANYLCTHENVILVFPELRSNEGNKHQNYRRVSSKLVNHGNICIIECLTRHDSPYMTIKDGLHTSTLFLDSSVYDLRMTSHAVADDITAQTRELIIVRYLTRWISILFTAICMARHVKRIIVSLWNTARAPYFIMLSHSTKKSIRFKSI